MRLNCNVLVDGLGWFTLIPKTAEISGSDAVEIGGRLLEMISGVKRIEFSHVEENKKTKPIVIVRCEQCNLPNFIDPNYVHGENGDPFAWHCTFCTHEIKQQTELWCGQ